jgi:hypothetical protein
MPSPEALSRRCRLLLGAGTGALRPPLRRGAIIYCTITPEPGQKTWAKHNTFNGKGQNAGPEGDRGGVGPAALARSRPRMTTPLAGLHARALREDPLTSNLGAAAMSRSDE